MLYAAAFQASFPYTGNRAALEAASQRRNLAALLTEYWYGSSKVARALGVEQVSGRLALRSDLVHGAPPADKGDAKRFLQSLRAHFEDAGLPTRQIDPRQPRAMDNLLETAPGDYRIVDLESGLVAPVASVRSWARGFRRGAFPLFDDVHFDITRGYVGREESQMREALGDELFDELVATLEAAEESQARWRAGELRLWGRFAGGFWSGWNYRAWPGRMERTTARGREKANAFLNGAVNAWESEGRLTAAQAAQLYRQVRGAEIQAVMPQLGAHGAITLALRFPFGSIARAAWTGGALATQTGRLLLQQISLAEWKRSWTMHSPVVLALSLIPGFGAFAYLAVRPVRSNRLLIRAAADALCLKVPLGAYERSGARQLVAPRSQHGVEVAREDGTSTGTPSLAA